MVRALQPMEALAAEGEVDATVVMLADLDVVPWDTGIAGAERPLRHSEVSFWDHYQQS